MKPNLLTQCWEWTEHIDNHGYGHFQFNDKNWKVHVLSYEFEHGPGSSGGRWDFVCHHCDNRKCVNPSHLYLGDPKSNQEDASRRGRHSGGKNVGWNNHRCKLGDTDIQKIKEMVADGMSRAAVGRIFSVNGNHIGRIVNGKRR